MPVRRSIKGVVQPIVPTVYFYRWSLPAACWEPLLVFSPFLSVTFINLKKPTFNKLLLSQIVNESIKVLCYGYTHATIYITPKLFTPGAPFLQ